MDYLGTSSPESDWGYFFYLQIEFEMGNFYIQMGLRKDED